ncbi:restriction endonuclease subunit S [Ochrovirga pacifica]|uniref:restriction endonuclease subunit S n=1 Tax=Ochrovirga pacifica TaxID=1042376 RepID=UPI000255A2BF|nr:restriction endonuclease subunit S [Ochrovirga pacifica]
MEKYKNYKDSGIEWIGEIPEHWKLDKINRLFKINTGFTPPTGNDGYYKDGQHVWITIRDLEGKYVSDSKTKLTDLAVRGKTKVPKGSLLYSFKLSVGQMAFAIKDLYTNEAIFSIFPNDNINLNYYYYLLDRILIHNSNENIYGAKILNQELIKAAKLVIPSKDEQNQIANYLDYKTTQIDRLVAKKEQLIKLLQEERTAIINLAVTKGIPQSRSSSVVTEFSRSGVETWSSSGVEMGLSSGVEMGLSSGVEMKDSGIEWLGQIPKHWEFCKIKNVTQKIGSGVTPRGGAEVYRSSGVPLIRSQNVYFDGFKLENVAYITKDVHNLMINSKVLRGDVLLNITGGSIGRCYFVTDEFNEANVNQHVCIVRPNERISTEFIYYILSSKIGQLQIDLCQTGGNREALNFEQLKRFLFGLPPIEEQKQIINFIESEEIRINTIITKTQQEIALLKEYKTALISEVVTGKVDIRNVVLN